MRRRIRLSMLHAFILTGLLLLPRLASAYVWHEQSGTTAVAIDPSTPSTLYVGTRGNGVFKSTDGGQTWTAMTGSGASNQYVSSLAIDRSTPTTVYAATYGGVLKTTNAGATWAIAGTTAAVTDVVIHPLTSTTLYAVAPYGDPVLLKSTDSGATWSVALTFDWPIGLSNVVIDPGTPSVIYIGASYWQCWFCEMWDWGWAYIEEWGQVLGVTDAGATWSDTRVSTGVAALAVAPASAAPALYAADRTGGLFKSVDRGFTWSGTGLQTVGASDLAVDPLSSSTIYAAGDGMSKSTDAAATWASVTTGLTDTLVAHGFAPSVLGVTIDPTTPTTVYVSTGMGVFKSVNSGASWTRTGLAQQSLLTSVRLESFTNGYVPAGSVVMARVTLAAEAPAGGLTVAFSRSFSADPTCFSAPAAVTVPAGSISVMFEISTSPACTNDGVKITAANQDASRSVSLATIPPE
jgi:hypothetical protein